MPVRSVIAEGGRLDLQTAFVRKHSRDIPHVRLNIALIIEHAVAADLVGEVVVRYVKVVA